MRALSSVQLFFGEERDRDSQCAQPDRSSSAVNGTKSARRRREDGAAFDSLQRRLDRNCWQHSRGDVGERSAAEAIGHTPPSGAGRAQCARAAHTQRAATASAASGPACVKEGGLSAAPEPRARSARQRPACFDPIRCAQRANHLTAGTADVSASENSAASGDPETLGRPPALWRAGGAHRVRGHFCGGSAARTTFRDFIGARRCSAVLGRMSRKAWPSKPGALTTDPAAAEKWANTCRSVGFRRRPTAVRSRFRARRAARSGRHFVSMRDYLFSFVIRQPVQVDRNRGGGLSASDITIYLALIFGADRSDHKVDEVLNEN